MSATVADLPPKTIENAKRHFVELYGSALVTNTYLRIALALVSLLALGLLILNFRTQATYATVKPLVVRIDEVGRAWSLEATFERACDPSTADALHARWRDAVGRTTGWDPRARG